MENNTLSQRKIIHIDMDAFFAAVEQRDDPNLLGKPVVVGGSPQSRGVVCAASYEARKFGVKSAMACSQAYRLCPDAIFIKPNFYKYQEVSQKLRAILEDYTDLIEPLSLDEAFLDVTHNKKNIPHATTIAHDIKERIKQELHLTASCGVATNKLLAKIASDYNKPDGICVVKPQQALDFMKKLELRKIPGVGKVTQKKLSEQGLVYCKDVYQFSKLELSQKFGRFGTALYYYSRGIDNRSITTYRERKSIGKEKTFAYDTNDIDEISDVLRTQIDHVCEKMKMKNIKGKTITLKVKYHDFETCTRSITLPEPIADPYIIEKNCHDLLSKTLVGQEKIRLVGMSISNFSDTETRLQLSFNF